MQMDTGVFAKVDSLRENKPPRDIYWLQFPENFFPKCRIPRFNFKMNLSFLVKTIRPISDL